MASAKEQGLALPTQAANRQLYEKYLSDSLGRPVRLVEANPMREGFRNRLWRVDISRMGSLTTVILRTERCRREQIVDEAYPHDIPLEFETLKQLRRISLPVPEVWGLDDSGVILGAPCFLMEFIQGVTVRDALGSGDGGAEDIFLEAVCCLQAVTRQQLGPVAGKLGQGSTARDTLTWITDGFARYTDDPLVSQVHDLLWQNMPVLLEPRFGNGDLTPSNMLVRDGKLVGLVDFEFAGFFDPMMEFLAPFGWSPELRNRRLEERFRTRCGLDIEILDWYRAATVFGWWLGILADPEADYAGYSISSCRRQLQIWIEQCRSGT